jgi:hypothetical protein
MRRFTIVVVLVFLSLAGSGCFDSSTRRTSSSNQPDKTAQRSGPDAISGLLTGRATVSGGPCVCPRPLKHGVFELRAGGEVAATITTDKHGRFNMAVPAGRYRISTITGAPLALYPIRPRTIEISADETTQIALRFGI